MGWFVHRYRWRAYAIPILIAVTVAVVLEVARTPTARAVGPAASVAPALTSVSATSAGSSAQQAAGAAAAARSTPTAAAGVLAAGATAAAPTSGSTSPTTSAGGPAAPTSGATGSAAPGLVGALGVATAALPAGAPFVAQGKGSWHLVKGTSPVMGSGGPKYTFTVEVEDGIEDAAADQQFAAVVDAALADPRSWIGSGRVQLQRIDTGTPSFRVSLTSQLTVRNNTLCGWQIHYEASCYARDVKRVAINDARWARGAMSFDGDLAAYRVYAVNHEVGHALGYVHRPCPTSGGPAPVMMQQSWSTADDDLAPLNPQLIPMDGKVCTFNPYPYPSIPGAASATPTQG